MITDLAHLDYGIRQGIKSLLKAGELDSAIRKALVLLKTRVCEKLGISMEIDGDRLVSHVFGPSSSFLPKLTTSEREAHRLLFSSMYSLLRNRYMHRDVKANFLELDAILSNVNLFLYLVDDFHLSVFDVIIIEPEKLILDGLADAMQKKGFSFRKATGLKSAKEITDAEGVPSIVVTDRVFFSQDREFSSDDRRSPYQYLGQLRDQKPDVFVVFTSDYGVEKQEEDISQTTFSKPFSMEQFGEFIASKLEQLLR